LANGKKRSKKNSNYKYDGGAAEAKRKAAASAKQKTKAAKKDSAKGSVDSRAVNIILIVFAAIIALAILVGIVIGIVALVNNRTVDYYKDNLGRYVYIDKDDYKSFEVENTVTPVTDMAVEQAVLELLCANKGEALNNKNNSRWLTLTPGDEIILRYIGYTLDEDGNRVYFDGGCNFREELDEEDKYEFGSGNLILGFELGMLGKNTQDYAFLERYDGGTVQENDIIYLTYTVFEPDGTTEREVSEYIDLSSPLTEKLFGKGFKEYFVGKPVGTELKAEDKNGKEIDASFTTEKEDGDAIYTDMKIGMTFRIRGGERLTVEAHFPKSYQEESLRGVTAYFDVFVERGVEYEPCEYNDKFVTEILKIDSEVLDKHEGASPSEKYLKEIRAQLQETYERELRIIKEQALLDGLLEAAKVKRLPKGEVNAYYNSFYDDLVAEFNSVGKSYGYQTIDEFGEAYYGLDEGGDWRASMRSEAEDTVKMKLVFHYLCNEENITLDSEEWEKRAEELQEEYLANSLTSAGITKDKYKTEDEYNAKVQEYREKLIESYGEEFFKYEVYYAYAMDILVDRVEAK